MSAPAKFDTLRFCLGVVFVVLALIPSAPAVFFGSLVLLGPSEAEGGSDARGPAMVWGGLALFPWLLALYSLATSFERVHIHRRAAVYVIAFVCSMLLALVAFVAFLMLVLLALIAAPGGYFGSPTWGPTIRGLVLALLPALVAIGAVMAALKTARATTNGGPRG